MLIVLAAFRNPSVYEYELLFRFPWPFTAPGPRNKQTRLYIIKIEIEI